MSEVTSTVEGTTERVDTRKRFSFGPVWNAAVIAGTVKDHQKLIAHAVKLKIAAQSDAKRLKFETLLAKVASALKDEAPTE